MIIVIQEKESGMNNLTKNKPIKFKGGPGNAGIMHPAIPRIERSIAKIRTEDSIFSYPFYFAFFSWDHNAF